MRNIRLTALIAVVLAVVPLAAPAQLRPILTIPTPSPPPNSTSGTGGSQQGTSGARPLSTPTPSSYPMSCEVGTMNQLQMHPPSAFVSLGFTRSSGAAPLGLQAGQCAFEDRAVRSTEPTYVCLSASVTQILTENKGYFDVMFSGPGSAIAIAATSGPTKLFTVNVTLPPGAGCFQVTSYGV